MNYVITGWHGWWQLIHICYLLIFINECDLVMYGIFMYHILLVHNRNHPKKRLYVKDEVGNSTSEKRDSNSWYKTASKYSESNVHNIFNPQYKSLTWEDVWQTIK